MSLCYELYRVRIRYLDKEADRAWEARQGDDDNPDDPPPDPKEIERMVAIRSGAGWAGAPLKAAGDLAARSFVGPEAKWDEWEPEIISIELVDGCLQVEGTP